MKNRGYRLLTVFCVLMVLLSMPVLGCMEEEPSVLSPRAQAFRDRLLANAQRIYNQEMSGFINAERCMQTTVNHRLSGYLTTLHNANQYNLTRDFVFDVTEIGVNVGIAALTGDAKGLLEEVVTTDLELLLEEPVGDLLDAVNVTIPPTTTKDMIYTIADEAKDKVHYQGLLTLMEKVESNGGQFDSATDAFRYISMYQENKGCFYALEMASKYYHDQLNTPWYEQLYELGRDIVIANVFDLAGGTIASTVEQMSLGGKYLSSRLVGAFDDMC
ncbi:MAG: hypothetical protein IJL88_07910, partial [Clostridia bacterium]|nr:hypothetical protein [Clostridia bacterium]